MPEGPEIRRAADRVAKVLVGQPIVEACFGLQALKRFGRRIEGSRVTAVDTLGKAMLTRFDCGLTMYSHNQLYGRWYTLKRPRMPKTNRSLRVALLTPTHGALLYSASDIAVLTDRQLERHSYLRRIGPDILDPRLTAIQIADRLDEKAFRNRALGSLYLDQTFLAGNGNYLRSEILWATGVNPWRRPVDLDRVTRLKLAKQSLRISRRSYRTRGLTVTPALATKLKGRGMQYHEYRFYVFGREGLSCHRCGSRIERRTMGSRSIYVCKTCQPS